MLKRLLQCSPGEAPKFLQKVSSNVQQSGPSDYHTVCSEQVLILLTWAFSSAYPCPYPQPAPRVVVRLLEIGDKGLGLSQPHRHYCSSGLGVSARAGGGPLKMYLMFYTDAEGERVYTLKVAATAFAHTSDCVDTQAERRAAMPASLPVPELCSSSTPCTRRET